MEQGESMATDDTAVGYVHSVQVPNKLKTASKFIANAVKNGVSLKTQLYKITNERKRSVIYSLIRKIVQYKDVLDAIIKRCQILKLESRMDPHLCLVLTAELLFGNGLKDKSKPSLCIQKYETKLFEYFKEHKSDIEGVQKQETRPTPRYIRVNTNLISRAEAIELFKQDGWDDVTTEYNTYDEFLEAVQNLCVTHYLSDMHVQNLFVFPWSSKQTWARHYLVKECKLILQDKASCLPAFLLDPPRGSTVLDMCAAPGMKTTHLAAIMKNRGTIHAIEFNDLRYITLNEFVTKTKTTIVKTFIGDAMNVNDDVLKSYVEYILLDPPCSGSGMDNRLALFNEGAQRKLDGGGDRLFQLGGLQIRLLCHAMKDFPNARRIVYSTCSKNEEENEHVIQRSFEFYPDLGWELVKPIKFAEKWKNFGNPKYKHIGKKCIYAIPEIDHTTGFFVAILERNFGDKPEQYKREKLPPQIWHNLAANTFGSTNGTPSFGTTHQSEVQPTAELSTQHDIPSEPIDADTAKPEGIVKQKKKKSHLEATSSENGGEIYSEKKEKKKKTKEKHLEGELPEEAETNEVESTEKKKKKKKSSKEKSLEIVDTTTEEIVEVKEKKKKLKKFNSETEEHDQSITKIVPQTDLTVEHSHKKKHKKEKKEKIEVSEVINLDDSLIVRPKEKKCKSKNKEKSLPNEPSSDVAIDLVSPELKRKKRKAIAVSLDEVQINEDDIPTDVSAKKKKKKKKHKEEENHNENCAEALEEQSATQLKKKKKKKEAAT